MLRRRQQKAKDGGESRRGAPNMQNMGEHLFLPCTFPNMPSLS